jgi:hypothetical protein
MLAFQPNPTGCHNRRCLDDLQLNGAKVDDPFHKRRELGGNPSRWLHFEPILTLISRQPNPPVVFSTGADFGQLMFSLQIVFPSPTKD